MDTLGFSVHAHTVFLFHLPSLDPSQKGTPGLVVQVEAAHVCRGDTVDNRARPVQVQSPAHRPPPRGVADT